MDTNIHKRIKASLSSFEQRDYNAISRIIDLRMKGLDVVVISKDPHLLFLVFTSLIRYYGVNVHILNPEEGVEELQRLLYVISPGLVIFTDDSLVDELDTARSVFIDNAAISHEDDSPINDDGECEFTLITYSPFPTRIHRTSSHKFTLMVESFINDLIKFNLVNPKEYGVIPFVTNNPDYLLHFIGVKLAKDLFESYNILPSDDEHRIVLTKRKFYLEHNRAKTLFIPKKEFDLIWEESIAPLFEYKFLFKSYLKRRWLINTFIRWKLKKLFEGFNSVLIIGTLTNSYMIDILKNLSFINFYCMYPVRSACMYGPISKSLDTVSLGSNDFRQDNMVRPSDKVYFADKSIFSLTYRLSTPDYNVKTIYSVSDTDNRFTEGKVVKDGSLYKQEYILLGDINNAFIQNSVYIFPETLEKVINSYPFIRNSVLLTFNKRTVLVINPRLDVLDSNRINNKMLKGIIQNQIDALNKELPEAYQIQGFVLSTSLIEQDRCGDIVRYPFNYCNKMEWSV